MDGAARPEPPLARLLLLASRWFDTRSVAELETRGWPRLSPAQSLVFAFLEEDGMNPQSTTETYAAVKLEIATRRWHGVPFLLRTGKMLDHSSQRLSLVFRSPADGPLTDTPKDGTVLTFDLAGDGAIDLAVTVKEPGSGTDLSVAHMTEQLDQVAPRLALASMPTTVCQVLGMKAATRSPMPTPASRRARCRPATWAASCA